MNKKIKGREEEKTFWDQNITKTKHTTIKEGKVNISFSIKLKACIINELRIIREKVLKNIHNTNDV